jgi:hypothetical protein
MSSQRFLAPSNFATFFDLFGRTLEDFQRQIVDLLGLARESLILIPRCSALSSGRPR